MKAVTLISGFLVLVLGLLTAMVKLTQNYNQRTIDEIAPTHEEASSGFGSGSHFRLSIEERRAYTEQLTDQLTALNALEQTLLISLAFVLALGIFGALKAHWKIERFDGFAVLLLATAYTVLYTLQNGFCEQYIQACNATLDFGIGIDLSVLFTQPILYYVGYRLTRHEVASHLHHQRWITVLALSLTAISGLFALALGFALVFLTPDFSGGIS